MPRTTKRQRAIEGLVDNLMTVLEESTEDYLDDAAAEAWPHGEAHWYDLWDRYDDPAVVDRIEFYKNGLLADTCRALADRLLNQPIVVEQQRIT